jgi:hypothetical protein
MIIGNKCKFFIPRTLRFINMFTLQGRWSYLPLKPGIVGSRLLESRPCFFKINNKSAGYRVLGSGLKHHKVVPAVFNWCCYLSFIEKLVILKPWNMLLFLCDFLDCSAIYRNKIFLRITLVTFFFSMKRLCYKYYLQIPTTSTHFYIRNYNSLSFLTVNVFRDISLSISIKFTHKNLSENISLHLILPVYLWLFLLNTFYLHNEHSA